MLFGIFVPSQNIVRPEAVQQIDLRQTPTDFLSGRAQRLRLVLQNTDRNER